MVYNKIIFTSKASRLLGLNPYESQSREIQQLALSEFSTDCTSELPALDLAEPKGHRCSIKHDTVDSVFKSQNNMQRGVKNESVVIQHLKDKCKYHVYNQQKAYRSKLTSTCVLFGNVDSIIKFPKFNVLLEVKVRRTKFQIGPQDYCQVQLYLWQTGLKMCLFVQLLGRQLQVDLIERDDCYIKTIIETLATLADKLGESGTQCDKQTETCHK